MVTIADRLWSALAEGIGKAAAVYAKTDEDNAREVLRQSLEAAAGGGTARDDR